MIRGGFGSKERNKCRNEAATGCLIAYKSAVTLCHSAQFVNELTSRTNSDNKNVHHKILP